MSILMAFPCALPCRLCPFLSARGPLEIAVHDVPPAAIYLQRCSSTPPPRAGGVWRTLRRAGEVGASAALGGERHQDCLCQRSAPGTRGPAPAEVVVGSSPATRASLPAPCCRVRSRQQRRWTIRERAGCDGADVRAIAAAAFLL